MDSMVIQLEKNVKVAKNGKFLDVGIITINLPSMDKYNLYSDVISVVSTSIVDIQNKFINEKDEGETDETVEKDVSLPIIIFATSGTINELSEAVNGYLIGCCTFDDDVKITKTLLTKLSIKDYNNILSKVAGFLFKSISSK